MLVTPAPEGVEPVITNPEEEITTADADAGTTPGITGEPKSATVENKTSEADTAEGKTPGPALAATGANLFGQLLLAGLALLIAGGCVIILRRRRA